MANAATKADRAYEQVVEWLEHFEDLEDPRQSGKVAYPLSEMWLAVPASGACRRRQLGRGRAVRQAKARLSAPVRGVRGRHAIARPVRQSVCRARRRGLPGVLHRLGRGARKTRPRYRRHRRQDTATVVSAGRSQGADPHDLSILEPPAVGARPTQGRRQIERDHSNPRASRSVDDQGCDRHHRRGCGARRTLPGRSSRKKPIMCSP